MSDREVTLSGGNVAASVVRVGNTVRKPVTAATGSVGAFLRYLEEQDFPGSPRYLGADPQGRQSLEYIPGEVGWQPAFTSADLVRVGALIRRLHELSAAYHAPSDARWDRLLTPDADDLLCHNDLAPWNFVRGPGRWAFIDWDGMGPGSRLWDLSYAAITFPPVEPASNPQTIAPKIAALVHGYELSAEDRARLPAMMQHRAAAGHDLLVESGRTGREPWARLFREGHAAYWGVVARFLGQHRRALEHHLTEPPT